MGAIMYLIFGHELLDETISQIHYVIFVIAAIQNDRAAWIGQKQ
jgi:hypothetical protein